MAHEGEHAPGGPSLEDGFTRVDAQPDPSLLTKGMEQTAEWPAVRFLRAWEGDHLEVGPGHRVLDVGCGLGDVSTALAASVVPGGDVVGIDASRAMLDVARARVPDDRPVDFVTGDAAALGFEDATFDAVRSERVLQWLDDPAVAIAEMVRVLRPGGRLVVTDTDWRTLQADVPDLAAAEQVFAALHTSRGAGWRAGSRLLNLVRDAGLVDIDVTSAAHVWTAWDPDTEPTLPGLFPLRQLLPQLVEQGLVEEPVVFRLIDELEACARAGRLYLAVTMISVFGRKA
jgi:SAM-dependent methyltransferase